MKDKLEQFIEDNRDSFDDFSTRQANKIWGKIAKERQAPQKSGALLKYLSRAAAVLLIFGLSYLFHDFIYKGKADRLARDKMNDIYKQIPELKEAEGYYSNLVSSKMEEIKPFLASDPEISNAVNIDLSELDSVYASLKNDLKDNVANDQIVEAMIQNYRLKLQILEELLAEINREKNNTNEKPKVNI